MFGHQKLDVYRCSIDFLALASTVQVPRGYAHLGDQLRRAALSVPLNIAEGVGKTSEEDQLRFFAIARGSAMECGAIVDCLQRLEHVEPARASEMTDLLGRVYAMLTRMLMKGR
jgi:four helix bundle protein